MFTFVSIKLQEEILYKNAIIEAGKHSCSISANNVSDVMMVLSSNQIEESHVYFDVISFKSCDVAWLNVIIRM